MVSGTLIDVQLLEKEFETLQKHLFEEIRPVIILSSSMEKDLLNIKSSVEFSRRYMNSQSRKEKFNPFL